MPFRPCPSGCGRFLSADDGNDRCLQCLGIQHAEDASRRYSSRPRRSSTSCPGTMHHPSLPPWPGLSLPVAMGALLRPPELLRPRLNRPILPVASRVRFGDDIPPHAPLASPAWDPACLAGSRAQFDLSFSLTALPATAVGQARASPHGQHCSCLVHQPAGRYTITLHVTARPSSSPLESHTVQVTASCSHPGEAQSWVPTLSHDSSHSPESGDSIPRRSG